MSEKGDLRLAAGMVGGGEGADIGKSHRHAMRLDGHYDLVAGVFGRDPTASTRMAERLGVPPDRAYRDYAEMAEGESARTDGVDVVTVATPNDSHFAIASEFLRRGISVVCEEPLTQDSASSAELVELARRPARSSLSRTAIRPTRWSGRRPGWFATVISARSGS
jgi:predicted dehydrogenase